MDQIVEEYFGGIRPRDQWQMKYLRGKCYIMANLNIGWACTCLSLTMSHKKLYGALKILWVPQKLLRVMISEKVSCEKWNWDQGMAIHCQQDRYSRNMERSQKNFTLDFLGLVLPRLGVRGSETEI